MTLLVADIGGTNTRLGLAHDSRVQQLRSYRNDNYPSFDAVLAEFLTQEESGVLVGAAIALAGPVTSTRAQLTNRDWSLDTARISAQLPGAPPVRLINDLVALGHSVAALTQAQRLTILPGIEPPLNRQFLVAGLGTGFNVCLLRDGVVMEAELGHASVPLAVVQVLRDTLGQGADAFTTNEAVFSGGGLSEIYRAMTGKMRSGSEVVGAAPECRKAAEALALMAQVLGIFARELVFQYQPLGGIYFNGGAARGILSSDAAPAFVETFGDVVKSVPVHVITDDHAALLGAARSFEKGGKS